MLETCDALPRACSRWRRQAPKHKTPALEFSPFNLFVVFFHPAFMFSAMPQHVYATAGCGVDRVVYGSPMPRELMTIVV